MARGDAADDDDDPMDDDDDRAQRHPFRDEEERDDVVALAVSRKTDATAMGRRIIREALRRTCGGDGAAFDGARDVFRAGQCSGGYRRRMRQRQNLHQTYRQPKRNLPGSDILFAREIPKDDKDGLHHWKKEYDDDSNFHELEWVPFWACDTIEYMLNHAMRGYYPDTFMTGIEKFTVSGRKVPEYETDSMYVLIYLQKNIRNLGCLVDAALWYRQNYANSRPIREDTLQINKCGNFEKTPLEYLAQIYDWCMEETDVNTVQNLFVNLALSGEVEDLLRIGDIYNDTWIASRKPTCASPSLRYRRAVIDLAPVFASRGFKC